MRLAHTALKWKEATLDWVADHVSERGASVTIVILVFLSALFAAGMSVLLPEDKGFGLSPLVILSIQPFLAVGLWGILTRRGWSGPFISLSLGLYVGLTMPEPFVTHHISPSVFIPPLVALIVARFWWMPLTLITTLVILLWRAGFEGAHADPMVLTMITLIIGCLTVNRLLAELSHRRTVVALAEQRRISETLDRIVAERTGDLEQERDKAKSLVEQQRVSYRQVSHDLRGDMTRITASMEYLREAYQSGNMEEITVSWWRLTRWVRRINSFASDLLDVAVIDRLQLRPDMVCFGDVLGAIVDEMQVDAELYRVELILGPTNHLPLVWCDADRIGRVLRNLIGNAIRYTYGVGDHVRVDAIVLDDMVVCSVTDDGPGIDQSQLGRLGQEFVRLNTDRSAPAGTGIGLSFCRYLVHMSGGTFEISSAGMGGGTIVTFTVPVYNGQDDDAIATSSHHSVTL